MKIHIIAVGRIKEKYLTDGIDEYLKRLSKYADVEITEVKDEPAPDNLSEKDIEIIKEKEGERILSKLKPSYVISLAINGKNLDSIELSKFIQEIQTYKSSDISFIIGGSHGLSGSILDKSDSLLSFSKLTFPHQLIRLILVEQLYRSFRISNNEPYHK